ncbi:MAG: zinc ribbon domain-containing protein [Elusimicrobia bacterium]|nr:zinc ribbon domain-containing protein [Elusimicrobiota bacterium]
MKCSNCGQDNRDSAKVCRKCGRDLATPPAWFPDARWHLRTLGIIYAVLVVFYFGVSFLLRKLPKPYHIREIAPELTPWLKRPGILKHVPEEGLKPPSTPEPSSQGPRPK